MEQDDNEKRQHGIVTRVTQYPLSAWYAPKAKIWSTFGPRRIYKQLNINQTKYKNTERMRGHPNNGTEGGMVYIGIKNASEGSVIGPSVVDSYGSLEGQGHRVEH